MYMNTTELWYSTRHLLSLIMWWFMYAWHCIYVCVYVCMYVCMYVHVCVYACMTVIFLSITILKLQLSVRVGGHRKRADPGTKSLFLCKTEVWNYCSWLTDTDSNRSSSRLNQLFQKCVGQNRDRHTSSGPKATTQQGLGFEIVHSCFAEVGDSVLGLEFFRAKLLDE